MYSSSGGSILMRSKMSNKILSGSKGVDSGGISMQSLDGGFGSGRIELSSKSVYVGVGDAVYSTSLNGILFEGGASSAAKGSNLQLSGSAGGGTVVIHSGNSESKASGNIVASTSTSLGLSWLRCNN